MSYIDKNFIKSKLRENINIASVSNIISLKDIANIRDDLKLTLLHLDFSLR